MIRIMLLVALIHLPARLTAAPDLPVTRPSTRDSVSKLRSEFGDEFRVRQTPHFAIAYDTDPDVANSLVRRLEQTYAMVYRFCEFCKIETHEPDELLEVVLFNHPAHYRRHLIRRGIAANDTAGMYWQGTNRSYFFNTANSSGIKHLQQMLDHAREQAKKLEQLREQVRQSDGPLEITFSDGRRLVGPPQKLDQQLEKESEQFDEKLDETERQKQAYINYVNQLVIQHETAHQVFFNAGVHVPGGGNPLWIVEGLACLFETPPGEFGIGFNAVNHFRLQDFRDAVADDESPRRLGWRNYFDALADGRLPTIEELVSDQSLLQRPGARRHQAYAAAWALTHYLRWKHPEKLAAYLAAIRDLNPRRPIPEAEALALFESHFGKIDDVFRRRFARFILSLRFRQPVKGWN